MKVIKPQKLSIVTRSFEHDRQPMLGLGVMTLHSFDKALSSEMDLWKFLADELGAEAVPDAGMPKSNGEVVVTGSAYQLDGEAKPTCPVRIALGSVDKSLYVIGDRFWVSNSRWTDPQPFVQMPLTWSHAFGGEGFEDNPQGKGAAEIETEHGNVRPLPNIETAGSLVDSPTKRPVPAGFGPIDFVNPRRFRKAGTYDGAYLKERFPGFAEDMRWSIFNVAPEDQHIDGFFEGTEEFVLEGMHPSKPQIKGTLPGIAARAFLAHGSTDVDALREVEMRLTTVWVFPHAERYLLVFHGSLPVGEDDAIDVTHGLFAVEDIARPKTLKHYHSVLSARLDPDRGTIAALNDEGLLPTEPALNAGVDAATAEMERLNKTEQLGFKYQRARMMREFEEARENIVAMGLDPDELGLTMPPAEDPPPPSLEELPDVAEKMLAQADAAKEKSEADRVERDARLRQKLEKYGMDADAILAEPDETPVGPPDFSAEHEHQQIVELAEDCRRRGYPIDELDDYAKNPDVKDRLVHAEKQLQDSYRAFAHHQTRAPQLHGQASREARERVLSMAAEGASFDGVDFTGVDLAGAVLTGANLEGAFFESASLAGAVLVGAQLRGAVLAGADLTQADLSRCDLTKANLGDAELRDVNLDEANLFEAILERARLTNVSLRGANLTNAELDGVVFHNTDASGAQLVKGTFMDVDFRGLRLHGALLTEASFVKGNVSGVDFSGAELQAVTFLGMTGEDANFAGANLTNARFVEQSEFNGAIFTGADLNRANLRGTSLRGADFSDATLSDADLSSCDLQGGRLDRVSAREAMFVRADLTEASLERADLMKAVLQKAIVTQANFREANLYQADVALIQSTGGTVLDGANQVKMRVFPVWEPRT